MNCKKRNRQLSSVAMALCLAVVVPHLVASDFDGNGFSDLAIGAPYEDIGSTNDSGAVSVIYGSAGSLTGEGNQLWYQDLGLTGSAVDPLDAFGNALAACDFNGDGLYDLAIGVAREDVGAATDAGAVNVIYGSGGIGLATPANQVWNQSEPGVLGNAESDDLFGSALACGDFNGDSFDDLAIGVPFEDVSSTANAGGTNVLFGSAAGLTSTGDQFWDQDDLHTLEEGDYFGFALATGDFDGDGYDDLAVGSPGEDVGNILNGGTVDILYGSGNGLRTRTDNDQWHQDRAGMENSAETYDRFGYALATGDLDGDGFDDLIVGVPYEDTGTTSVEDAGGVQVMYGTFDGITAARNRFFTQDSSGIASSAEEFDYFGWALATGDFDDDGYDDAAVGVPREDWDDISDCGAVNILYGSPTGINNRDEILHQAMLDEGGLDEEGDRFGSALAAADFDCDGYCDLAVGAPNENIGSIENAGAVFVLPGGYWGMGADNQVWWQSHGIQGAPESGDRFGSSLAAVPSLPYLGLFEDDFETGTVESWSEVVQ